MRRWIANKLAGLARRIYPQSEEVMGFYADRFVEMVITGQSFIKVTSVKPEDVRIVDIAAPSTSKESK